MPRPSRPDAGGRPPKQGTVTGTAAAALYRPAETEARLASFMHDTLGAGNPAGEAPSMDLLGGVSGGTSTLAPFGTLPTSPRQQGGSMFMDTLASNALPMSSAFEQSAFDLELGGGHSRPFSVIQPDDPLPHLPQVADPPTSTSASTHLGGLQSGSQALFSPSRGSGPADAGTTAPGVQLPHLGSPHSSWLSDSGASGSLVQEPESTAATGAARKAAAASDVASPPPASAEASLVPPATPDQAPVSSAGPVSSLAGLAETPEGAPADNAESGASRHSHGGSMDTSTPRKFLVSTCSDAAATASDAPAMSGVLSSCESGHSRATDGSMMAQMSASPKVSSLVGSPQTALLNASPPQSPNRLRMPEIAPQAAGGAQAHSAEAAESAAPSVAQPLVPALQLPGRSSAAPAAAEAAATASVDRSSSKASCVSVHAACTSHDGCSQHLVSQGTAAEAAAAAPPPPATPAATADTALTSVVAVAAASDRPAAPGKRRMNRAWSNPIFQDPDAEAESQGDSAAFAAPTAPKLLAPWQGVPRRWTRRHVSS